MSPVSGRLARCLCLLALSSGLAACQMDVLGESHPRDLIYYPMGLAADPLGKYLYVVNGNFDLAYRSGSVVAIDVGSHQVLGGSAIGVGSFGGQLALISSDDGSPMAGYVPSRADNAVYYFSIRELAVDDEGTVQREGGQPDGAPLPSCQDVEVSCRLETRLSCTDLPRFEGDIDICDSQFRLDNDQNRADLVPPDDAEQSRPRLGADPFGVTIVAGPQKDSRYLLVTSLRDGLLSLIRLDGRGRPTLVNDRAVVAGLHSVAYSKATDTIIATSRYDSRLYTFQLEESLVNGQAVGRFRRELYVPIPLTGQGVEYGRGLTLNASGTRAYVGYRNPSSLVILDVSRHQSSYADITLAGVVDLPAGPADLFVADSGPAGEERVYVVSSTSNEIWVVDPLQMSIVDLIQTGQTPYFATVVKNPALGLFRAYVSEFEEHAVGVIELDASRPLYHHLIAHIR